MNIKTRGSTVPAGSVTEPAVWIPAHYLCPFVFAVAFFCVRLTRLMKNVRHDCLQNPLICAPDPINRDPASATNSSLSIGFILTVMVSDEGVFSLYIWSCLPNVSTVLPVYQLFQWLLLQSWMGFKNGAGKGDGKEGSFPHFRFAGLSQLGLIMYIQQTLTCLSTPSQTKPPSVRKRRKQIQRGRRENTDKSCKGFSSNPNRFMGL